MKILSGARDQNLRDLLASGHLPDGANDHLGVGIQSWIVPLVMLRVVNTVVWVHSDWCEQLPDGTYHLSMGLKKNLANKIFGFLARCEFWLKLGLGFWIL